MSNMQGVLLQPAQLILAQVWQFVLSVLLVIVILIIGWLVSKLIKTLVIRLLRALKLDDLSDRIELDSLLAKGGISYSLSELIGIICYWIAILITFAVAVNAVGLTIVAELLQKIVLYVPNVIGAIFILVLGMFIATILRNIVRSAASNAGLGQANLLSNTVEVIIVVFAILMAIEQLGIVVKLTEITLSIILGSLGLGLALAFGLGCKDIAGKSMSEFIDKLKKK